jgi:hypothetical protein
VTSPLAPREEQVLAALAAGDLQPGDPEVVALARASVAFAMALARQEALQARLDTAGSVERALQAQAPEPDAELAARAADAFRRMARSTPQPGAPQAPAAPLRRRRPFLYVAAAAVLLLAVWLVLRGRLGQDPDDATLSGSGLELLAPEGDGRTELVLRWDYPARGGVRFKLQILAEGGGDAPLFEAAELTAHELRLGPSDLTGLPRAIRWRVAVLDAGGQTLARRTRSATLGQ